jgi:hypothetical protein
LVLVVGEDGLDPKRPLSSLDPGQTVIIQWRKTWEREKVPLNFQFLKGPLVHRDFSISCSIGFVCASLGLDRGVLFDRIKIDCDSTTLVGDIPDVENRVFAVSGETVIVHWTGPAPRTPLKGDVPIPYFRKSSISNRQSRPKSNSIC